MKKPIAFNACPTIEPVLFFDGAAARANLAEAGEQRINAAKKLLGTLAACGITEADGKDLNAVAEAAYLLLSDGYDLYRHLAFDSEPEAHHAGN